MEKTKVLFVSVNNAARGQIAESLLKTLGSEQFYVESAGLEPRRINSLAVEVMKEIDIEITNSTPRSIFAVYEQNKLYHYVISIGDEDGLIRCLYPFLIQRLIWSVEDPSGFTGPEAKRVGKMRKVRDQLREYVENFLRQTGRNEDKKQESGPALERES
jgi:arsenate reductase (thioredoxin)